MWTHSLCNHGYNLISQHVKQMKYKAHSLCVYSINSNNKQLCSEHIEYYNNDDYGQTFRNNHLSNTSPWRYHSVHIGKQIPSGRGQMCPPP